MAAALGLTALATACGPSLTWRAAADQAAARLGTDARPAAAPPGALVRAASLALLVDDDHTRALRLLERATAALPAASTDAQSPRAADAYADAALLYAHLGRALDRADLLARAVTLGADAADVATATLAVQAASSLWGHAPGPQAAPPAVLAALRRAAARPGPAAEPLRAAATYQLYRAAALVGTDAQAAAALRRAGVITRWRTSAPWGHDALLDLDRPLGPETRPLGALPSGLEPVGTGFQPVPRAPTTHRWSDGEVFFPDVDRSGGVGFADAWIAGASAAPMAAGAGSAARRVILRVESNLPLRVFANGVQVASLDPRDGGPWFTRVGLVLPPPPAGTAAAPLIRLTVKAASLVGHGFFRARVTPLEAPAQGVPALDLAVPPPVACAPRGVTGSQAEPPVAVFTPPPTPLETGLAATGPPASTPRPGDARGAVRALALAEALLYRPTRALDAAHRRLDALRLAFPAYPGLALDRERLAAADPVLPAAPTAAARRGALEEVLKTWPNNVRALSLLGAVAQGEDRHDEALALWGKALELRPDHADTLAQLAAFFRRRGWEAEALDAARRLAALPGRGPRPLQAAVDVLRTFRHFAEAEATEEKLRASFPRFGRPRAARLRWDAGHPAAAAGLLAAAWRARPEQLALAREAVAAYRAAGDGTGAQRLLDELLAARPADPWALEARVTLELAAHPEAVQSAAAGPGTEPARRPAEAVAKALAEAHEARPGGPQDAALRRLESWLAGREDALGLPLADAAQLAAAYRASARAEANARYPFVTLLDRTAHVVDAQGGVRALTHVVRLIQSKAAADRLGDISVPRGADVLVVRTLKKDGGVLWPERVQGKSDLSLSGLEPGDVIEYAWETRDQVRPAEGGYVTGLTFAYWNAPTVRKEAVVSVASPFQMKLYRRHGAPEPVWARRPDGGRVARWVVEDLRAVPSEPQGVGARGFFPFVDVAVWPAPGGAVAGGPAGGEPASAGRELPAPTDERPSPTPATLDAGPDAAAWNAMAQSYADRLARLGRVGRRTRARAAALRRPKGATGPGKGGQSETPAGRATGPWALARAAFEYVKSELDATERFNTFQSSAEMALALGKGNRAVALWTLGRALGLRTRLLLCAPRQHGAQDDAGQPVPNANRFWYAVVAFRLPVGDAAEAPARAGAGPFAWVYADPTRPYTPLGLLPPALYGARCMAPAAAQEAAAPGGGLSAGGMEPTGGLFEALPAGPPAWLGAKLGTLAGGAAREAAPLDLLGPTWRFKVRLRVGEGGKAWGTVEGAGFGPDASALRRVYLKATEGQRKMLWQQWTASLWPGVEVTSYQVWDADASERPMRWKLRVELPGYFAADGAGRRARRLAPDTMGEQLAAVGPPATWVRLAKRETPLGLTAYSERLELWVTPPKGKTLETALGDLPPALTAPPPSQPNSSQAAVRAAQRVSVNEATGALHLTRSLRVRPARVTPSDYPAFREWVRKLLGAYDAGATLR